MRIFLLSILLTFILSCSGCSFTRSVSDIYSESRQSVFMLSTREGHCTTFHVGDGYFVTASHCVDKKQKMHVLVNKTLIPVDSVVLDNVKSDLAVLRVPLMKHYSSLTLRRDIRIGSRIVIVGYPGYSKMQTPVVGYLVAYLKSDDDEVLVADVCGWPGESGGPVFDEQGFVIGIVSGVKLHLHEMESAVPLQHVESIFTPTNTLMDLLDPIYRQDLFPRLE